jgi:hypothetical protein
MEDMPRERELERPCHKYAYADVSLSLFLRGREDCAQAIAHRLPVALVARLDICA